MGKHEDKKPSYINVLWWTFIIAVLIILALVNGVKA